MKIARYLLASALLTSGCSETKPVAKLSYIKIFQEPSVVKVDFSSNVDLEGLYAENKYQKIVVKKLTCALGDDENFDVEHSMQRFFRGTIDLVGSSVTDGKITYRYSSRGDFYENSPGRRDMNLLRGQSLIKAVSVRKVIPCKVIMTVYMAAPYYSATMYIPVSDVMTVSELPPP